MKIRLRSLLVPLSVLLAFAVLGPNRTLADNDDPPTRVARLGHVDGQVSFNPAGTDDWVSAVVNRPMTTGDKLWADQGGRAELHIGSAVMRIGEMTGFFPPEPGRSRYADPAHRGHAESARAAAGGQRVH